MDIRAKISGLSISRRGHLAYAKRRIARFAKGGLIFSTNPCFEKRTMTNRYWVALVILSALLEVTFGIADEPLGEARSEHWVEHELRQGKHKLSPSEREGVYRCSLSREKVIEVQFDRGFVSLIFDSAAPVFFKESEISSELLQKLRSLQIAEFCAVLCVHSSFRDDWQTRYDSGEKVNHQLLDIIVAGKN
jgi:hypothetical protein